MMYGTMDSTPQADKSSTGRQWHSHPGSIDPNCRHTARRDRARKLDGLERLPAELAPRAIGMAHQRDEQVEQDVRGTEGEFEHSAPDVVEWGDVARQHDGWRRGHIGY